MKRKKKHKPKCPNGGVFGYDIDEIDGCDNCPLYNKCNKAFAKWTGCTTVYVDDDEPEKKKKPSKKKQDHRGVYIPYVALNKLFALTKNYNCITLYVFYLKTAVRQKTNQIWSNNNFAAKGLRWDRDRVRITKNQLVEAGYIKIIWPKGKSRDEQGHFSKNYIKLKYYPSKMVIEKEEYLRQLDEYERQFDFYMEKSVRLFGVVWAKNKKLEVENMELKQKLRKLWEKYKKLKKSI
jgi:hypothetical protein